MHASAPLRILLIADGIRQPRWLVEAIELLGVSGCADIVGLVVASQPDGGLPGCWQIEQGFERRLLGVTYNPDQPLDLRQVLPACPVSRMPPVGLLRSTWKNGVISREQPDLVFLVGDLAAAEFVGLAASGVWQYSFGHDWVTDWRQAGLDELCRSQPLGQFALRVQHSATDQCIVAPAYIRSFPFSLGRHRANLLKKASALPARAISRLHREGTGWLAEAEPLLPPVDVAAERHPPPSWPLALLNSGRRAIGRGVEKLFRYNQWCLAYRFGPFSTHPEIAEFTYLLPPADREWADPFPYWRDGRHYIFFEEIVFSCGKGRIAVVEIYPDGRHGEPRVVLETDCHLSYPFLIEAEGELYMVPESGARKTVEIYRCLQFPDRWELARVLLKGLNCADATLHHDAGGWWMFLASGPDGSELYDELHLYHATSLFGEWLPHPANPLKVDARNARPAGALFRQGETWYRPAQICIPRYGSGVSFCRIDRLGVDGLSETEVGTLSPPAGSGLLGIHTFNHVAGLTVIDGFQHRSRRQMAYRDHMAPSFSPPKIGLPAG